MSRSLRARGLKQVLKLCFRAERVSRSLRARGLKLVHNLVYQKYFLSRSLRARGLKPQHPRLWHSPPLVALFTGAWIETNLPRQTFLPSVRRALYGRVD